MQQIAPMLALAAEPFNSPEHLFEIKWDGVRCLAAVESNSWRLWGRQGVDYTVRYPELAALQQLPTGTILDGELVQLVDGRADFGTLLRRHQLVSPGKIRLAAARQPVNYVVFDLLELNGRSLLSEPLWQRRQRLEELVAAAGQERLVFSQGVIAAGQRYFHEVIEQGHEGVMAKQLNSSYLPGKRAATWRKIKPRRQAVCVIFGYRTMHQRLDSLLLAAQDAGGLRYVGAVSSGLTGSLYTELERLLPNRRCTQPLVKTLESAQWVRPELYCLVRCFGFTSDGHLRFPRVLRLLQPASAAD